MRTLKILQILLITISLTSCGYPQGNKDSQNGNKAIIEKAIGAKEYTRLMGLSLDDFDQSNIGFRQYTDNYELICLIIPEYINISKISINQSANLHWHLGQMHAFNQNIEKAIAEMEQSNLDSKPIYWKCYVEGTIAFLKKDKPKLLESLETLRQQDNQMNIRFLEKFVKYFDKSYREAYNAEL